MKDPKLPGEVLIKRQFHEMKDAESDILDSQDALDPTQNYRAVMLALEKKNVEAENA
jgi:hypothetical protein